MKVAKKRTTQRATKTKYLTVSQYKRFFSYFGKAVEIAEKYSTDKKLNTYVRAKFRGAKNAMYKIGATLSNAKIVK